MRAVPYGGDVPCQAPACFAPPALLHADRSQTKTPILAEIRVEFRFASAKVSKAREVYNQRRHGCQTLLHHFSVCSKFARGRCLRNAAMKSD